MQLSTWVCGVILFSVTEDCTLLEIRGGLGLIDARGPKGCYMRKDRLHFYDHGREWSPGIISVLATAFRPV